MKKLTILKALSEAKIVAVIRGNSHEEALAISKAAIEGGIQAIELTYTTPYIEEAFKSLRDSKALIGAGTVIDEVTARHAILNGAQFIVSPNFNLDIAKICNRYSIPYLPGCMTIKEMIAALEGGSDIIKLFPSNLFEPSFINSVKGPLPNITIMPTGGINLKNMNSWLDEGAIAVGIASDLNKAYQNEGSIGVKNLVTQYINKL